MAELSEWWYAVGGAAFVWIFVCIPMFARGEGSERGSALLFLLSVIAAVAGFAVLLVNDDFSAAMFYAVLSGLTLGGGLSLWRPEPVRWVAAPSLPDPQAPRGASTRSSEIVAGMVVALERWLEFADEE